MRIYLDAAPTIYVVEQILPYSETLDRRFSDPTVTLITSDMCRMECRIKPLREGNLGLLADFGHFFQNVVQEIVLLSPEVIDLASRYACRMGFARQTPFI